MTASFPISEEINWECSIRVDLVFEQNIKKITQAPTSITGHMYAAVLDTAEIQNIFLVLRIFL